MRSWTQYGFLHGLRHGNQGLREFPWNRAWRPAKQPLLWFSDHWTLSRVELGFPVSGSSWAFHCHLWTISCLFQAWIGSILPNLSDEKVKNCTDFSRFTELLFTIRVNGKMHQTEPCFITRAAQIRHWQPLMTSLKRFEVGLYYFVSHSQLLRQYPGHLRDGRQSGPLGHCSGHTVGLSQFPLLHTDGAAVLSDLVGRPAGGGRRRRRRGSAVELRPGAGLAIAQVRETRMTINQISFFRTGCGIFSSPTSKV